MPTVWEDPFVKANPNNGLIGSVNNNSVVIPPVPTTTTTTAANQNWANGDLKITDQGVYFSPYGSPSATTDTVEGRMAGLLSSESPYLTAAKTRAKEEANKRGLINSTMAATAGEKAAIESSLPIAQQDAGYFQNIGLENVKGKVQSGLQQEQGQIQTGLYKTQGEISKELSTQAAGQEAALSKQKAAETSTLSAQEAGQAAALSKQQAGQSLTLEETQAANQMAIKQADIAWNKIDLQARMDVEAMRLDQDTKKYFNDTVNSISNDFQKDYMSIMTNSNFTTPEDRQAAIDIMTANTQQRYRLAGEVAKVQLTWEVPEIKTTTTQAATQAATPTNNTQTYADNSSD